MNKKTQREYEESLDRLADDYVKELVRAELPKCPRSVRTTAARIIREFFGYRDLRFYFDLKHYAEQWYGYGEYYRSDEWAKVQEEMRDVVSRMRRIFPEYARPESESLPPSTCKPFY